MDTVVPLMLAWIKEQPDLGGADCIREHEQMCTDLERVCSFSNQVWGICHYLPSQKEFLGPGRGSGLPSMGSTLLGVLFVSSCDLWPAHSACRSTCGDANIPSLLPSTQPQCCRMWMTLSSLKSALGTMETSLTPPACRWLPPPSTAGQSLMVGEAGGDLGHRAKQMPTLASYGNHSKPCGVFLSCNSYIVPHTPLGGSTASMVWNPAGLIISVL